MQFTSCHWGLLPDRGLRGNKYLEVDKRKGSPHRQPGRRLKRRKMEMINNGGKASLSCQNGSTERSQIGWQRQEWKMELCACVSVCLCTHRGQKECVWVKRVWSGAKRPPSERSYCPCKKMLNLSFLTSATSFLGSEWGQTSTLLLSPSHLHTSNILHRSWNAGGSDLQIDGVKCCLFFRVIDQIMY